MNITHNIDIVRVDESILFLKKHIKETSINPLISALEALRQDPHNETLLRQLFDTFNKLDIIQGAVLTYAPYISILLSNNPFEND